MRRKNDDRKKTSVLAELLGAIGLTKPAAAPPPVRRIEPFSAVLERRRVSFDVLLSI